jgi:hypothetical protein
LWDNKRIIVEVAALICLLCVAWWFFIHNPKVINGLEQDKIELARQVANGTAAINLLDDINKGKAAINAHVFTQISTLRATAVPRRTVIIHGGLPLPALH